MKTSLAIFSWVLAIPFLGMTVSAQELISNVTATASQFWSPTYTASLMVDESGLNPSTGEHDTNDRNMWWSQTGDHTSFWLEFDLGSTTKVGRVNCWNFNGPSNQKGCGIWQTDIYISAVADPGDPEGAGAANWEKIGNNVTFPVGPCTNTYTGFDLETEVGKILPSTPFRYMRFEINSRWADNGIPAQFGTGFTGFSEIQFFVAPPPKGTVITLF